jgi:hypothetical protein
MEVMVEYQSGCAFCGKELLYIVEPEEMQCVFCNGIFKSQAKCADNHFVCDTCHSLSANELIQGFTIGSESKNPLDMAITLMKSPSVKMHGPEHHFLVPAVLLSAFCNSSGRVNEKEARIAKARQRAEKVLGGFCGFYGNCGAAVGTGIFMSVLTDATPLSQEEWKLSNLLTADSLHAIAHAGGPRCCKRDSFLAILEAARFVKEHLGTEFEMDSDSVKCQFHSLNKECKKTDCRFYTF